MAMQVVSNYFIFPLDHRVFIDLCYMVFHLNLCVLVNDPGLARIAQGLSLLSGEVTTSSISRVYIWRWGLIYRQPRARGSLGIKG